MVCFLISSTCHMIKKSVVMRLGKRENAALKQNVRKRAAKNIGILK